MTHDCPKLRADLQVSEQHAREGTVYVLKEPAGGRMFRLAEVEYYLARQLDGATPPEALRQKVEAQFGAELGAEACAAFVGELRRLGLLEGAAPRPQSRLRGDLLYLRLKAFDPDAFLDRLLPKVRFCFTAGFLWSSVAALLLAIGVTLAEWPDLAQGLGRLGQFHAIVYAWLVLLATVSLHELAHGLTCKHFGGQVREMGFMLIYFQPALYCNVSDAWMFPEKSQRLWVTFAGAWFDLLLWALAVLVWRVTDPDAWLHFTALVVIATAGVRTLFNLNPLIKLDGYYLLSDALELPNLRARAFKYLAGLRQRWWSGRAAAAEEVPARERRIYVVYGLLAAAYSAGLLGSIAWMFGGYLVERLQGLGFLLFTLLLTLVLRHPLRRTFARLPENLRRGPSWFHGLRPQLRALVVALAVLLPLVVIPAHLTVSGELSILPVANADIRAEVEGVIAEIYVKEGDSVQTGTPIARLADQKVRAESGVVEAAILEKQARLKMLRAGPRQEDIALARERVAKARTLETQAGMRHAEAQQLRAARLGGARAGLDKSKEELGHAEQMLARQQALAEQGFISKVKYREAETDVAIRRKALEEAQAALETVRADALAKNREDVAMAGAERREAQRALELLLAGARPGEIEAMEAELASLEARRDYLRGQLQRLLLRSPHAGLVTTPRVEERIGQYVAEGDLIAEVHEHRQVVAEITVPERDIAAVRVGQPVLFKARAYPGETFRGEVTRIAPAAAASDRPSGAKIVRVTTLIDNDSGMLKSGMTGYAKIQGERQPLIASLGRSVVGALRVEVWSWW
jgi:multidrug efflux pump subunit AcrA (membrane-fusion protein)